MGWTRGVIAKSFFPEQDETDVFLAGQKRKLIKFDENTECVTKVTKLFDELHVFAYFFTLISLLTCDIVKVETNENMEPSEAAAAGGFSMPWR